MTLSSAPDIFVPLDLCDDSSGITDSNKQQLDSRKGERPESYVIWSRNAAWLPGKRHTCTCNVNYF